MYLVQGRMVRAVTRRERAALQVTMIVLVDMQLGPVYLRGKPFIYEARESSLVPEGFLTAQFLQNL